jgi:hypothetical protein
VIDRNILNAVAFSWRTRLLVCSTWAAGAPQADSDMKEDLTLRLDGYKLGIFSQDLNKRNCHTPTGDYRSKAAAAWHL